VHSDNREHLVHVGAKVQPDLADAVRQLADDGNRSLSREIRAAITEHVKESSTTSADPSAAARSATASERGDARAPRLAGIRPSSGAPDTPGLPTGARPKDVA
jgi:hypothetical protein